MILPHFARLSVPFLASPFARLLRRLVLTFFCDLTQKTFLRRSFIYVVYFLSRDDFDDVEVILEQIKIRTADYYKPRWVSFNEKTIVNVIQNIWVYLHFLYFYFKSKVK